MSIDVYRMKYRSSGVLQNQCGQVVDVVDGLCFWFRWNELIFFGGSIFGPRSACGCRGLELRFVAFECIWKHAIPFWKLDKIGIIHFVMHSSWEPLLCRVESCGWLGICMDLFWLFLWWMYFSYVFEGAQLNSNRFIFMFYFFLLKMNFISFYFTLLHFFALLIIFWGPRLWVLNFRSGCNMPGEDAAADKSEELAVPQPSEVGRQTGRDLEKQTLQNHLPHSPELQNQSGQVFHWTKRVLLRILWYSVSLSGSSFDFFYQWSLELERLG